MNIMPWLNDTVNYKSRIGQTGSGDYLYNEKQIKCRIDFKDAITYTDAGQVSAGQSSSLASVSALYTIEKINIGDVFSYDGEEYEIIKVNEFKEKSGRIAYYMGVYK